MDPVARRFMWEVISDIVTKREKCSLILTTHSMEECEALCTRIGIMVGGVLRCLGSAQRLRTRYGEGYQIEIGLALPSQELIMETMARILTSIGKPVPDSVDQEVRLTLEDIFNAFNALNHGLWSTRIAPSESGADLKISLDLNSFVTAKHLTTWWITEESADAVSAFMTQQYGTFVIRERQMSKIRMEVSSVNADGSRRDLSSMFGSIERRKEYLRIQEYSISQTSLEQIFNFFASQVCFFVICHFSEGVPISNRFNM